MIRLVRRFGCLAPFAVLVLLAGTPLGAQPPAVDLYLAPLQVLDGNLVAGAAEPLVPEPGYDNQPFFLDAEGRRLLFTSDRAGDQTEIFELDLETRALTRRTDTAESEYSPTPVPRLSSGEQGDEFSVVRVEADGVQRLWAFGAPGSAPRLLLPEVRGVGYHAWIDEQDLLLFVLGTPMTLRRATLGPAPAGAPIVERPGRAVHRATDALRGGPRLSFVATHAGRPWVFLYDPARGESEAYAPTFSQEGDQDLAWMADGTLLMSAGSRIGAWKPTARASGGGESGAQPASGWRPIADFASQGIASISRLAVSATGQRLVFVASDAPAPSVARRTADGHAAVAAAAHARERSDWGEARRQLQRATRLVPAQPGLVRRLAGAEARDGRAALALTRLETLVRWRTQVALATDPDLEAVRALPGYADLRARLDGAIAPVERSHEALRLATSDFVPEGIAFDPVSERFFVSSVRWGRIEQVDSARVEATPFADLRSQGYGGSVLGIAVDPGRRSLWALTADLAQAAQRTARNGSTALCELDLDRGTLRRCLAAPEDSQAEPTAESETGEAPGEARHLFNDLVVARDGTVYVSDPAASAVHRLVASTGTGRAAGASSRWERWLGEEVLSSPGGLALSADERRLYIADYALGLLVVDRETGAVGALASAEATLVGIDGLVRWRTSLLAIQNGVQPPRIVRFDLGPEGTEIVAVETLEIAVPSWDEPTLGVVVEGDLYYVSNSHWPRFAADGSLPGAETLAPPIVRRLPLSRWRPATPSAADPGPR